MNKFFKIFFSVAIGAGLAVKLLEKLFASWRFNIYDPKHWQMIWELWTDGASFNTTKQVTFLLLVLFSPFIVGLFCFISYKIDWLKLLLSPVTAVRNARKEKKLEKARHDAMEAASAALKKAPAPKVKKQLPERILRLRGTLQQSLTTKKIDTNSDEALDNDIADNNMWKNIEKGLERNKIFTLRCLKVADATFDLAALTQEGLYLLYAGPTVDRSWETRDGDMPPVWISDDEETLPSPVAAAQKGRDIFQQKFSELHPEFSELTINASVVLGRGKIANIQDMLEYLEETDMSVLRAGTCRMKELPDSMAIVELIKTQSPPDDDLTEAISDTLWNLTE